MKWLADENFDNAIIRGLLRQIPTLDIIRAQDVPEISGQDDRTLLRFATAEGRVVVTHDVSTMIPVMCEHVRIESQCAPIVLVPNGAPGRNPGGPAWAYASATLRVARRSRPGRRCGKHLAMKSGSRGAAGRNGHCRRF